MVIPAVLKAQWADLPIAPASEYAGRTYLVTGANTGLGFECAKHLVEFSASRVILAVRSQARGDEAKAKIEAETGRKGIVETWILDLSSYASVKAFAKRACEKLERIDGVIENASVALAAWSQAEDLETTLTVNVVSTYLLAVLLLPKLKADAKRFGIVPHLVIVGSGVGFMGTEGALETLKGDIFDQLNNKKAMSVGGSRYSLSKLLQTYVARELAFLVPVSNSNVVINYLSPGLCITSLDRNAPLLFRTQLWAMRKIMGRTAEMGSRTLLHAVVAGKDTHGKYLSECESKEQNVPGWVTDANGKGVQKRLWNNLSARLEKIEPGCVTRALNG